MTATAPATTHRGDDGIAVIHIAHGKGNIFDSALMAALEAELRALESHHDLRAVVLTAAGNHFSFGASVEEHRAEAAAAMLTSFHRLIRVIAGFPVPIVAAVQGRCLGGAFEVALACHVVIADAQARFACPEIKLGVFPPVLAAIGDLRLGGALAERLLLTGDDIDVTEAARAGMVAAIAPDPGAVGGWARAWAAQRFGGLSAASLRQATRAGRLGSGLTARLAATLDALERQYVDELVPSHDGNEGIEAFLARRPPVWRHG